MFENPKDYEVSEFVLGNCIYEDRKDGGDPVCLGPVSVEDWQDGGKEQVDMRRMRERYHRHSVRFLARPTQEAFQSPSADIRR